MIEEGLKNRFDIKEMGSHIELMKSEMGFPEVRAPENINTLVNNLSNLEYLTKLSPLMISEYSVLLSTYSMYLAAQENKLNAYHDWCEANIKHLVGQLLEEAPGYGFQEKDLSIRSNHPTAAELCEKQLIAKTKLLVIKGISLKLEFICGTLKNLYYEKARIAKHG